MFIMKIDRFSLILIEIDIRDEVQLRHRRFHGEGRLAIAMTLYSGKQETVPLLAFTGHVYGHPSRSRRPHLD